MFDMTEADMQMLSELARYRAAAAVGVKDGDGTPEDVVLRDLSNKAPMLAAALEAFLGVYRQWFDFHTRIEREHREGLSAEDTGQLVKLVGERDRTRDRFKAALHDAEAL